MVEEVEREILPPCKASIKYNFAQSELEEWDLVRVWIKGLLKERHKDYKLVIDEPKNGGE